MKITSLLFKTFLVIIFIKDFLYFCLLRGIFIISGNNYFYYYYYVNILIKILLIPITSPTVNVFSDINGDHNRVNFP